MFRAVQNLVDKVDQMAVQLAVQADAAARFDAVWLRNAVEEPLDEADIEAQGRLE